MTVTISKIAKEAGVSAGAVSKALNDKKDISPETKKHIQAIASSMGYSANLTAKALVSRKTMAVGVVIPYPELTTGMERIQGIQEQCNQEGYLTACTYHDGRPENEARQLNYLKGRVDGIIITPSGGGKELHDGLIRHLGVPVVFMSEAVPGIDVDFVSDDDEEGSRIAASHLLQEGVRNFAYLGNCSAIYSDQCAVRGIKRACEEHKCNFDDIAVLWDNTSKEKVAVNLENLIKERPDISGIFCFSDMAALWSMEYLIDKGIAQK